MANNLSVQQNLLLFFLQLSGNTFDQGISFFKSSSETFTFLSSKSMHFRRAMLCAIVIYFQTTLLRIFNNVSPLLCSHPACNKFCAHLEFLPEIMCKVVSLKISTIIPPRKSPSLLPRQQRGAKQTPKFIYFVGLDII